jgi:hypothetical protein
MAKRQADIAALEVIIRDSGVSFKTSSKSFIFSCPRCKKPDKLWIFKNGSSFVCFNCPDTSRFGGAPEYALKEITGRPLDELKKILYGAPAPSSGEDLLINILDDDIDEDVGGEDAYIPELEMLPDFYRLDTSSGAPGAKYLRRRGITSDIAMEYDIRYCPTTRSVIFPAWIGTRLVGWQSRIIDDTTYVIDTPDGPVTKTRVKALNSPDIPRNRHLVFENRLVGVKTAVICEGPVDALKCHFFGGNVATLGKKMTDLQISTICSYGVKKVVLGFDPDAAADFSDIASRLEAFGLRSYFVQIPKGYKDLGEMPIDEATYACVAAVPLRSDGMYVYLNFEG